MKHNHTLAWRRGLIRLAAAVMAISTSALGCVADDDSTQEPLDVAAAGAQGSALALCEISGDLNDDDVVDFSDFLVLSANYGGTGKTRETGDVDGDGDCDFSDYLALSAHYGFSCVQPQLPESLLEDDEQRALPAATIGYYVDRASDHTTRVDLDVYATDGAYLGRLQKSRTDEQDVDTYDAADGLQLAVHTTTNGFDISTQFEIRDGSQTFALSGDQNASEDALEFLGENIEANDAIAVFWAVGADPAAAMSLAARASQGSGGEPVLDDTQQELKRCKGYARDSEKYFADYVAYQAMAAAMKGYAIKSLLAVPASIPAYLAYTVVAAAYQSMAARALNLSFHYYEKWLCCRHWRIGSYDGEACGCDGGSLSGGIHLGGWSQTDEFFGDRVVRYNKPGDRALGNCRDDGILCIFSCEPGDGHPSFDWQQQEECAGDWKQCNNETLSSASCECSPVDPNSIEFACPKDVEPIWAACVP